MAITSPTPAKKARTGKARIQSSKSKKPQEKIPTYTRRKMEIEVLLDEMKRLNQQLDEYGQRAQVIRGRATLKQCQHTNKVLLNALQAQHLWFASSLSMLSQCFRALAAPFVSPMRLGADPLERQIALSTMRRDRLQVAHQFILQRQEFLGIHEFSERKTCTATNGDLVSERFEIVSFPELLSIKPIVDALQAFVYNIEIGISEATGDVTVRENDDATPNSSVAQHRLVTKLGNGVQVEENNVAFGEYKPADCGEDELALLVCDVVDEDEMFPYRPLARLHQDVVTIIRVAWAKTEDGKPIVVMTRWQHLRIHKPENMSPVVVNRMRDSFDKVAKAMLSSVSSVVSTPISV